MIHSFSLSRCVRNGLLRALLVMGLLLAADPAWAQSRILFVGNSFTHGYQPPVLNYNAAAITDENYGLPASDPRHETDVPGPWGGVPGIFKKFTDQAGLTYEVHIEAINGVTLEYHFNNALAVVQQVRWDQVVLQEYSTRPLPTARTGQPAAFFDYSTRLERAIHAVNPAAKIYLYETWARADLTYPANQPYSGLPIEAMGNDLHDSYYLAVVQNKNLTAVAPAGDAWLRAIGAGVAMRNPYAPTAGQLNLWDSYFHASKWGSYLNACVLFFQITGIDPRTLGAQEQAAADLGIAPADAGNLQRIAYEQVNAGTAAATYTLTVNVSGGGTVAKIPDQATYANGASVTLTANAAPGYQFTGWGGDTTATTNPLPLVMTRNRTITATFTLLPGQFALTVTSAGSGTVARNPDQASYASGSSVSLTATPAAGYQFASWSGDASGTSNPLTVVMTASKVLTATFTAVATGQQVSSFTLVNADTDLDLQPLANGAVLNLATLPTRNLNIRANTSPTPVGSVVFALSGAQRRAQTESGVPYALFGDAAGNYSAWVPALGSYTLTARPYTAAGGAGTAGQGLTLSFSVVSQATAGPFTLAVSSDSSAASYWSQLGPFTALVNDGTTNIAASGGNVNPSGEAPARTPPGSRIATTSAGAYPNPSVEGRFWVTLPVEFRDKVAYTLVSVLGTRLAEGEMSLTLTASSLEFDFSHEMSSAGLYFLLLRSQGKQATVRLVRP